MIDINKLLEKHYRLDKDEEGNKVFYFWQIKELLKDFGIQLLQEAADKSQVEENYRNPFLEPRIIVNKQSITSIINDINFD